MKVRKKTYSCIHSHKLIWVYYSTQKVVCPLSIDLYLIGNCKEFMTLPTIRPVSYGWGVTHDGNLRKPSDQRISGPIVLDDSIEAPISHEFTELLLPYCARGCILDWERKPSAFHFKLLDLLKHHKIQPIWLPKQFLCYAPGAYCMLLCELPHNSWRNFCTTQQQLYQNGWTLEYHPIDLSIHTSQIKDAKSPVFLREAICMTKVINGERIYYDTIQTILEKRKIAESYGCKGMIGIAEEWRTLRKK